MKTQALFSLKDKSKKIKMSSAAIFVWLFKGLNLFSALKLTNSNHLCMRI